MKGVAFLVGVLAVSAAVGTELPLLLEPQIVHGEKRMVFSAYDEVFNRVVRADRAADRAWLRCDSAEKIAAHGRELREKAIAALGGFPARCDLRPRVTGTVAKDGYRIEKVMFESRPGFHVTAHLFLPEPGRFAKPYPGIVVPCGHASTDAKRSPGYQQAGVIGSKAGFAVLVYDPIDQGERRQKRDGARDWSSTREHNAVGVRAALLGWNAAQFRIWDGLRAIDYLQSRDDVDGGRIGVMGMSGGGTLSAYINALDPRIGAGAPAGFLSTVRDVYDNCGPQDAEQQFFGQLGFGLNHLGFVCMRAPSPTMMTCSHDDFFPFMGSIATYEKAREVFAAAGAPDRVFLMETAGPHHWYTSSKEASVRWMRRWLCGDAAALPLDVPSLRRLDAGAAYTPANAGTAYDPDAVGNVTETGCVMDLPDERSAYDILREELAACAAKRPALTPAEVRRVTGIRPRAELGYVVLPASERTTNVLDGVTVRRAVLSRNDDLTMIPVSVCTPPGGGKGTPELILGDGADRTAAAARVRELLSAGRAAAIADLRGFGETAKSKHPFYGAKNPDEEIAVMMYALGDSLVARRAEDAVIAADFVAKAVGAAPLLRAEGRAAIPAAHAAYLEADAFAGLSLVNAPESWRKLLSDDFMPYLFANVIHGALRVYDWTELCPRTE